MPKWKIACIYILFFTLGVVLAYGHGLYSHYKDTLAEMHVVDEAQPSINPDTSKKQEPFALLLFGVSDTSPPDTFMLALIDPEFQKVQLISVPRDSYVEIPGYRKDKINAAYARGGALLLKKTLENWLDIKIAGYASINYQGFIDLVDMVDGLDIYVPRNMQYDDPIDGTHMNLKKGQQVLDGQDVLNFVRFRKSNDGNHASDYDRMERQQTALKMLGAKMVSIKTLSKYQEILNILGANIRTTLAMEDINFLIREFYSFDITNLQTTSMVGEGIYVNETWYEQIPETEMKRIKELINRFMESSPG